MGEIFNFLFGWGTPAATTGIQIQEMWTSYVSGTPLSQAWWDGTISSITNQVTNAPALVESAIGAAFSSIFYFLPDGGNFPPQFHEAAVYMGNGLQSVAFLLPVEQMVYCLILALNVLAALWGFHVIRAAVNFVRGIQTDRMDFKVSDYSSSSHSSHW